MFYEKLSSEELGAFMCLANEVVRADGLVTPEEMAHLQKLLGSIPKSVQPITAEESFAVFAKSKTADQKGVYIELLSLAMSDGVYDKKERQCMKKIQDNLGLSDEFANKSSEWLSTYLDVLHQGVNLVSD